LEIGSFQDMPIYWGIESAASGAEHAGRTVNAYRTGYKH
jgi:hypothetical protein